MEIKELTVDERLIVKLPSECVTGLRVDTNSRKWIFGMESINDLEVWTKVISENCIFATNFSETRDSLSKERCGSFERRGSRGWSLNNVKKSFGGVISKTMGLSRGLDDSEFFGFNDQILQDLPHGSTKEDLGSESDWKIGDNLLDLDTLIALPLQSSAPAPWNPPVKSAPVLKKASTNVSMYSDAAAPLKSAPVSKKASTNFFSNSDEPEMRRRSSFNDIAPRKGKVSSIEELQFGEDPLTADIKNELTASAPHIRSIRELLRETIPQKISSSQLMEREQMSDEIGKEQNLHTHVYL